MGTRRPENEPSKRDLGEELLAAVRDLQAYQKGEIDLPTRERAPAPDPAEIRARLELSQHAFAGMLGVSVRTIQDWEQGRRVPRGPAQSLLRIADRRPEVFLDLS